MTDDELRELARKQRLFIGVQPCGLVYCDRHTEVRRDYKRLAFLVFSTLILEWDRGGCPDELKPQIIAHAATVQARRGESYQVSACNHTVKLGG